MVTSVDPSSPHFSILIITKQDSKPQTSESMCDISIREYIRWLPDESDEPTSTIVLTTPERRFVDIRILKPTSSSPNESSGESAGSLA